jgi:hypothetical protein
MPTGPGKLLVKGLNAAAAKGKKPAQVLKNRGRKLATMLKTHMPARDKLKVATAAGTHACSAGHGWRGGVAGTGTARLDPPLVLPTRW